MMDGLRSWPVALRLCLRGLSPGLHKALRARGSYQSPPRRAMRYPEITTHSPSADVIRYCLNQRVFSAW